MKKQIKQFLVLLVLLIACVAVFVVLFLYNKRQQEREEEEKKTISLIQADSEDITAFSYYYEGDLLEFTKRENKWYYTADETVTLNQDTMGNMVRSLSEMEASEELENPAALSEYGLDEPVNTITVMTEEKAYVVLMGGINGITGQYYIKLDFSDEIYLTDTDYDSKFWVSLEDLTAEEESETVDDTEFVDDTESLDDTEE